MGPGSHPIWYETLKKRPDIKLEFLIELKQTRYNYGPDRRRKIAIILRSFEQGLTMDQVALMAQHWLTKDNLINIRDELKNGTSIENMNFIIDKLLLVYGNKVDIHHAAELLKQGVSKENIQKLYERKE